MIGLKNIPSKVWQMLLITLVVIAAIVVTYKVVHNSLQNQYELGFAAGQQSVIDDYNTRSAALKEQWENDKEKIENDAKKRIDAASRDASSARDSANSLQQTINHIRSIARNAGAAVSPGTTTGKAVDMLSDMLIKSNKRANVYAEFADRSHEAGMTCQIQYNELRKRIIESQ